MKITSHYKIPLSQPSLEFVDVDTSKDVRLFINARAIAQLGNDFGEEAVFSIQSYFDQLIQSLKNSDDERAYYLVI